MRNRQRDAKHLVVIATFVGLGYIAASQLFFGPAGSSVVRDTGDYMQHLFSRLLLIASALCVASGWIGHEPRGALAERAGMFIAGVALMYYATNVPGVVESWSTTMAIGYGATGVGCVIRASFVWRMIRHRETW